MQRYLNNKYPQYHQLSIIQIRLKIRMVLKQVILEQEKSKHHQWIYENEEYKEKIDWPRPQEIYQTHSTVNDTSSRKFVIVHEQVGFLF